MADSSSQQPSLTVLGGPMAGQRLVLDESVANLLIGSDPSCDFYLPHDSVSPIHARLWVDLDGATLHETSSPHGVYVNDERVAGKHPLRNGDIVWLGPPGGADVVMIQCVLPENGAEAAPGAEEAPADGVAEQEALDALAPTLAARPAFSEDAPGEGGEPPAWESEAEPPPVPDSLESVELDESSRTVAFRLPADFSAELASPPPVPEPAPPPLPPPIPTRAVEASAPPEPSRVDETLWVEHAPEPPPVPVAAAPEETLLDPHSYGEPEPTIVAASEPVWAEPEPEPTLIDGAAAAIAEPEPEIVEPLLPDPEPPRLAGDGDGSVPGGTAADLPSDFDDMMFSVPDEPAPPPAAPAPPAPPPAAADVPEETILLAKPPAAPAAPAPAPPAPAAAAPAAAPPAAAARPAAARPAAAPAPTAGASGTGRHRPVPPAAAAGTGRQTPISPAAASGTGRHASARPAARAQGPARSGGVPLAAVGGAGALLVAGAAAAYWFVLRPAPASHAARVAPPVTVPATLAPAPVTTLPAPEPPPVSEASPEPPVAAEVAPAEDVVTIVKTATPPPRPSAAPSAARPSAAPSARPAERRPEPADPAAAARARTAAQVASLLAQAGASASARNFDAASGQYDEVLRLDPQNAAAQAGKASVTAARVHARKAFVPGRTVVRTAKAGGGLAGFDSSGVNLQKAPDFQGRVEFDMTPASVQPGDAWELKIYVVNEGKKAIKISALEVATTVNGSPAGGGGAPKNREIAPQQRVIVDQLSGTWPKDVTSWRTDVKIVAGKNDSLQSQLTWR